MWQHDRRHGSRRALGEDPTLHPATSSALHRGTGWRLEQPHALRLPTLRRLRPHPRNRLPFWRRTACVSRWRRRCNSKQVGVWSCLPQLLRMQFGVPSHLWRYARLTSILRLVRIRCVVLPLPHPSTVETPMWSSAQALTSEHRKRATDREHPSRSSTTSSRSVLLTPLQAEEGCWGGASPGWSSAAGGCCGGGGSSTHLARGVAGQRPGRRRRRGRACAPPAGCRRPSEIAETTLPELHHL